MEVEYILIPLVGLLAFYLKGITGAGPVVVIISFSSLIIDPKSTIVLASFVNVFGGFTMLWVDHVDGEKILDSHSICDGDRFRSGRCFAQSHTQSWVSGYSGNYVYFDRGVVYHSDS